jgi:hypothetical protein
MVIGWSLQATGLREAASTPIQRPSPCTWRITIDINDLHRLREDKEAAADGGIRTHTLGHVCCAETGLRRRSLATKRLLLTHGFRLSLYYTIGVPYFDLGRDALGKDDCIVYRSSTFPAKCR